MNFTAIGYGVTVKNETQTLIDAIINSNSLRMKQRHLYITEDSRGQVICDNYDNPCGVALIIKDDEYFIHSCDTGTRAKINMDTAVEVAKNFFNNLATYNIWERATLRERNTPSA